MVRPLDFKRFFSLLSLLIKIIMPSISNIFIMNVDIFLQIIITSITAISARTLFSYAISESTKELYEEPLLLIYILTKMNISTTSGTKIFFGWLLHYFIGFCFVLVYHYLWFYEFVEMSWITALILGIISGIIGVFGWVFLFRISPKEIKINFGGYYTQLLIAHIIFTIVAFAIYKYLPD